MSGLGDLVGTNGGAAQGSAIEALKASPFYQSLFNNGQEALLANASATGGLRGGNTEEGLADFGRDTLSGTIQQQIGNLGGLAGLGIGATNSVANFGAQKANAVTGLLGNIGSAQASGFLTKGGITAGQWNNAGSFLDSVVSAIAGGVGGGAGGIGSGFNPASVAAGFSKFGGGF